MTQTKTEGKNVYKIYMEGNNPSLMIRSDSYTDTGTYLAFYNKLGEEKETVGVVSKIHIIAVIKQS